MINDVRWTLSPDNASLVIWTCSKILGEFMIEWISVEKKLPPPDTIVWICVKNKNKSDGIWLYDVCWHTGDEWGEREHTWETIIYWAFPTPPKSSNN
jgi:hypothetical protein